MNRIRYLLLMPLAALAAGCPVTQPQETPVDYMTRREPRTERKYRVYVPSTYTDDRQWPLVVALHGLVPWDTSYLQIKEWKYLAEQRKFIVAAPELKSPMGGPLFRESWYRDLKRDERAVLAIIDEISRNYNVDPDAVLLTAFSSGGYPLYYIGLRNPERFDMLIARGCNSDEGIFEQIEFTEAARKLPILIFWGKDDFGMIQRESWKAIEYLRNRQHCYGTERKEVRGGHLRRPELQYRYWVQRLPAKYRN